MYTQKQDTFFKYFFCSRFAYLKNRSLVAMKFPLWASKPYLAKCFKILKVADSANGLTKRIIF